MDRINGAGHVNHLFVAEDVPTNRPPTEITEAWLNTIQEELCAIPLAAGMALDPNNRAQLLAALRSAGVFQTPPQFDQSTKPATAEFVQRSIGNIRGFAAINATSVLGQNHFGLILQFYGSAAGQVITLPTLIGLLHGSSFWFENISSVPVTIQPYGAEITSNGGALVLQPNETCILIAQSSVQWIIFGTVADLQLKASIAWNGYQKLPSGLILQWGSATAVTTGTTVTFPLAFPTACCSSCAAVDAVAAPTQYLGVQSSATAITIYSNTGTVGSRWWAVGY